MFRRIQARTIASQQQSGLIMTIVRGQQQQQRRTMSSMLASATPVLREKAAIKAKAPSSKKQKTATTATEPAEDPKKTTTTAEEKSVSAVDKLLAEQEEAAKTVHRPNMPRRHHARFNEKQLAVYEAAVKNEGALFITGAFGTGKTAVARRIAKKLDKASTYFIGNRGSFLDIKAMKYEKFRENLDNMDHSAKAMLERMRTVVIDDVDQRGFNATQLDELDQLLRQAKTRDEPFGGVRVILTGQDSSIVSGAEVWKKFDTTHTLTDVINPPRFQFFDPTPQPKLAEEMTREQRREHRDKLLRILDQTKFDDVMFTFFKYIKRVRGSHPAEIKRGLSTLSEDDTNLLAQCMKNDLAHFVARSKMMQARKQEEYEAKKAAAAKEESESSTEKKEGEKQEQDKKDKEEDEGWD